MSTGALLWRSSQMRNPNARLFVAQTFVKNSSEMGMADLNQRIKAPAERLRPRKLHASNVCSWCKILSHAVENCLRWSLFSAHTHTHTHTPFKLETPLKAGTRTEALEDNCYHQQTFRTRLQFDSEATFCTLKLHSFRFLSQSPSVAWDLLFLEQPGHFKH